jgi:hypothetical protein
MADASQRQDAVTTRQDQLWTRGDVPAKVKSSPNGRLRALLLERGETPDKLAEAVSVDPKTVERWVTKRRILYRAHRHAVAAFFGVDESCIWPGALGGAVFQYVMPGNCSRACSSWPAHSRGQPKARAAWPLMSAAAAPLVKWTYSPQFIRRV